MQYNRKLNVKEPDRELKRKRTGGSYKELLIQKFKFTFLSQISNDHRLFNNKSDSKTLIEISFIFESVIFSQNPTSAAK